MFLGDKGRKPERWGLDPSGVDLDWTWSHRGLVGAFPFWDRGSGTVQDIGSGGYTGTLSQMDPATDWLISSKGPVLDFDGSNDSVSVNTGLPLRLAGKPAFTIVLLAAATVYQFPKAGLCFTVSVLDVNKTLLMYPFDSSGGNGLRIFWNGATIINQNDGAVADGDLHSFVFLSRNSTDHEAYVNGISVGTSTTSKTLSVDTDVLNIFNFSSAAPQHLAGQCGALLVYDRALAQSELLMLARDPFGPFREVVGIYLGPGSGFFAALSNYPLHYRRRRAR